MSTQNSSPTPKVKQMTGVTGLKALVGKRNEKTVQFMGESLKISKLSLGDIEAVQELSQAESSDAEKSGMDVMRLVIRRAVEGAADLTDDDFKTFALDDLSNLSKEIMEFSGMSVEAKGAEEGKG